MEENCRICQKQAVITCKCDKNTHVETSGGQHETIKLKKVHNEFLEKCKFNLEKINQVKSEIIRRSNNMIEAILAITKFQLSKILNNSDQN